MRLSDRTECKKFLHLPDASEASKQAVLTRLLLWCSRAKDFARQRSHVRFTPALADVPSMNVLQAQNLEERFPYRDVMTDKDLDGLEVSLESATAA